MTRSSRTSASSSPRRDRGADGTWRAAYLNPTLYALAARNPPNTLFHDVVRGDNLLYPATPGWDFATGLGSPIVSRLG